MHGEKNLGKNHQKWSLHLSGIYMLYNESSRKGFNRVSLMWNKIPEPINKKI